MDRYPQNFPLRLPFWRRLALATSRMRRGPAFADATIKAGVGWSRVEPAEDSSRRQRELSESLIEAQERERRRIARELHDGIGQNLSSVKMAIEAALREPQEGEDPMARRRLLMGALARTCTTIDDLRRIALNLRPSMLDELGLSATLDWLLREFSETNPEITLVKTIALEEGEVPPALRCDLYRVVQEALHNVVKHARASRVEVALMRDAEGPLLSIVDDGCGFDPGGGSGGMGLESMRARVEQKGVLAIHSRPGAGTCIEVRWAPETNR